MDDKKRIRKLKRQVKNLRALDGTSGEAELIANPELKGGAYMLGDHLPPRRVEVVSYGTGGGSGGSSVVGELPNFVQRAGTVKISGLSDVKQDRGFTVMLNDAMKGYEDTIRKNIELPIFGARPGHIMFNSTWTPPKGKKSYRARHRRNRERER